MSAQLETVRDEATIAVAKLTGKPYPLKKANFSATIVQGLRFEPLSGPCRPEISAVDGPEITVGLTRSFDGSLVWDSDIWIGRLVFVVQINGTWIGFWPPFGKLQYDSV